ncbi:phosphonate metabolism protein/1,5-bisphosphokinase (PRPP-forming) PhnN [Mesorhizobium sp. CAU 1741]|uniref:phosphonate metabolism protein/1,5-bisphosphokinase (PRPP-forming) PhnN n=1 Tax=Mesorhizobium sp. CAU 1741 TaxID=3140366 RepID=UPI00325A64A9
MMKAPVGPGVFVPVVGPSGAGKDSIIAYARDRLGSRSDILFARRVVTRSSDPHGEPHDTLDEASFADAEAGGAFALSWRSHGLCYGIPANVDHTVREGGVVVANLSRASVADAQARYVNVVPVLVSISDAVMAARLAARGREDAQQIAGRIARNADYRGFGVNCTVIDNDGALEDAGEAFIRILIEALQRKPAAIA